MRTPSILFICKNRDVPYSAGEPQAAAGNKNSSGLLNSVKFVSDMLFEAKIHSKYVDVVDNNCIDREVTAFKPTHVIIEALWVVPSKFEVLTKLHPNVVWIIRLHSEIPFIAGEGIATEWIHEYVKYPNVHIACNSLRIAADVQYLIQKPVMHLPNYYKAVPSKSAVGAIIKKSYGTIDIGCFGAIRPLKNQLIQAIAAMEYATSIGKQLNFHINSSRIEGRGESSLKNIQKLFEHNIHGHILTEHSWLDHEHFVALISQMDIVMQVSFTETYNIVTADAVANNVPVVTSSEIKFVSTLFQADCTDTVDIVSKLARAHTLGKMGGNLWNTMLLSRNSDAAKNQWLSIFRKK